jgi:hypothetical protein
MAGLFCWPIGSRNDHGGGRCDGRPYFFREVRFHKQQSRRRSLTPDGFALSPIRAGFLDSIVRVVEREVK